MESVSTSTAINPANLPPTTRAAFFHGLHVHLQVEQWEHLELNCLTPTEWGWQFQGDSLVPVKTDLEPAPESLLKFIRCSCKTTTKKTCGSQLCSSRKVSWNVCRPVKIAAGNNVEIRKSLQSICWMTKKTAETFSTLC